MGFNDALRYLLIRRYNFSQHKSFTLGSTAWSDVKNMMYKVNDMLDDIIYPYQPRLVPAYIEDSLDSNTDKTEDVSTLENGILWAVPKNRRPIEKRRTMKLGQYGNVKNKLYKVKRLMTCPKCAGPHEMKRLCPTCYAKNKEVTQEIQKAMNEHAGFHPIESEYVPIFQGESVDSKEGFYQGKRIFEVPIERPQWFSKNLLQKSNVGISDESIPALEDPLHIKIKS